MLLGFSIPVWFVVIASVLVRLTTSKTKLTIWSGAVTLVVAGVAGLFLHMPVLYLFGLATEWTIPVVVLVTLSAENIMRALVSISQDDSFWKSTIRKILEGYLNK